VHYVRAGDSAYVVTAGADGIVRYASAAAGTSPRFTDWRTIPGVTAAAEPAVIGRTSGDIELYVVSGSDGAIHRTVLTGGAWSPWISLASAGTGPTRVAGAPAAVALPDGRTELLVASKAGGLLAATGTGTPTGTWQSWHAVTSAGTIKPDVAVAVRSDGTQAAYVVRASDLADLRLMNDGRWSATWPTGAVGQPEAGYAGDGEPYLFIQSVSGDVQVYKPSGANLHGSMSWSPVGVTSQNPVGVTPVQGLGLVLTATAPDGTVRLYSSNA
jgi:hypothetical protein